MLKIGISRSRTEPKVEASSKRGLRGGQFRFGQRGNFIRTNRPLAGNGRNKGHGARWEWAIQQIGAWEEGFVLWAGQKNKTSVFLNHPFSLHV